MGIAYLPQVVGERASSSFAQTNKRRRRDVRLRVQTAAADVTQTSVGRDVCICKDLISVI
jgi:hypothetical protein